MKSLPSNVLNVAKPGGIPGKQAIVIKGGAGGARLAQGQQIIVVTSGSQIRGLPSGLTTQAGK